MQAAKNYSPAYPGCHSLRPQVLSSTTLNSVCSSPNDYGQVVPKSYSIMCFTPTYQSQFQLQVSISSFNVKLQFQVFISSCNFMFQFQVSVSCFGFMFQFQVSVLSFNLNQIHVKFLFKSKFLGFVEAPVGVFLYFFTFYI